MTKAEKFVNDFMQAFDENGLASPEKVMYLRAYQELEDLKQLKAKNLFIPVVSGSLSIEEVASKYGEKVKCMFYDYDDKWVEKTIVVNASFLKDMEQGAIKDCH